MERGDLRDGCVCVLLLLYLHDLSREVLIRIRPLNMKRSIPVEGQIGRHHRTRGDLPSDVTIRAKGIADKDVIVFQPDLLLVLLAEALLADHQDLREGKRDALA